MAIIRFSFLTIFTYFQNGFDLFPSEWFHRRGLKLRGRHHFHRIGDLEFVTGPMEKCGERHPHVADRFGGKFNLVIAGEPARHVLGQKIGDVLA